MSGKLYYRLKIKLFVDRVQRKLGKYARHITLAALLLSLVFITSSAQQIGLLTKYRLVYSASTTASAYNSMVSQCDSTPWITASGTRCRTGVIAANHLPIGTKVIIEGFGQQIFTVEDRMNRRYKDNIDIWMLKYNDALKFGRRRIRYHVIDEV